MYLIVRNLDVKKPNILVKLSTDTFSPIYKYTAIYLELRNI